MSDRLDTFRLWIKEQGLKATAQREDIAQVFFCDNSSHQCGRTL